MCTDMWSKLIESCPGQHGNEMKILPITARTNMLINGLNNSFTLEWNNSYKCVADFLYCMFREYFS